MIWMLGIILIAVGVTIYVIIKNKSVKPDKNDKKSRILKLIVAINIIIVCLLKIILPFARDINLYGEIIFALINIAVLIFSKKISNKKDLFIINIVVYFIMMCIIPLYKFEDYRHIFNQKKMYTMKMPNGEQVEFPEELIEEYTILYNCNNIKLLKK